VVFTGTSRTRNPTTAWRADAHGQCNEIIHRLSGLRTIFLARARLKRRDGARVQNFRLTHQLLDHK